jgi:predicted dehydrogenase
VEDPNVDAVVAAVPPVLNLEIARSCAAAGKPLLVEKPLAVSSRAGAEIVELFDRCNLPLTTGQTLRFNSVIRSLRKQLPSLGTLFSFSANQRLEPSSLSWHEDPDLAGAGVSFHTAVHVFDALRFITGHDVKRLMAVFRRHHNGKLEDMLVVMVEMDNGVIGTIDCSKVGNARSGRFEFVGLDGQLQGDQVHNTLERIHGVDVEKLQPGEPANTILFLLRDWLAFLSGHGENPVSGEEGLAAVRLCEACLESARTDTWVRITS